MTCQVCYANFASGTRCPHCGFDTHSAGPADPSNIILARERFQQQQTAYAPQTRVSTWDRWRPWWGVALGFIFFLGWVGTCSTLWHHGFSWFW